MRTRCGKARGQARVQGRLVDRARGIAPIEEEKVINRLAELARKKGVPRGRVRTAEQADSPIEQLVALLVSFVPSSEIQQAITG
jgi:hypothetical protein